MSGYTNDDTCVSVPRNLLSELSCVYEQYKHAKYMHENTSRPVGSPPFTDDERVLYVEWYDKFEEAEFKLLEAITVFMDHMKQ